MDEIASYCIILHLWFLGSLKMFKHTYKPFECLFKWIFIYQWVLFSLLSCKDPYILGLNTVSPYISKTTLFFPCFREFLELHTKTGRSSCSKLITNIGVDLITNNSTDFYVFLRARDHAVYRVRTHRRWAAGTHNACGDAGA